VTPSGCLGVVEEERKVGFSGEEKTTYTCVRHKSWHYRHTSTTRPGRKKVASSPMSSQAKRLMKKKGWLMPCWFQKIVALPQPVAEQQQQLTVGLGGCGTMVQALAAGWLKKEKK
jgi:hypothetical protein